MKREFNGFELLEAETVVGAIRRLAAAGVPEEELASASGLSLEHVRRIVAERSTKVAS